MEGTETLVQTADDAAVVAQPAAGDSGAARSDAVAEPASTSDPIRSAFMGVPLTSKPDAAAPAGESAPQGDVKPAENGQERDAFGRFIPRRGVPEAVRTAEDRANAAEARLADLDPAKLREQIRQEIEAEGQQAADNAKLDEIANTQAATVQRYRTLLATPDADLSAEDYQWREDYKEKLKGYPEVQQHWETEADLRVQQGQEAFNAHLRGQLSRLEALPGVDRARFHGTPDFGDLGQQLYDAGKTEGQRPLLARIAELEREVGQYRLNGAGGLGAGREPVPAGRSSAGSPPPDGNSILRGAFGY